jgi:serine/threonine-protein kinase
VDIPSHRPTTASPHPGADSDAEVRGISNEPSDLEPDVGPGRKKKRSPTRIKSLGDFQLGEKIGRGATGSVYRAIQVSKNRPAAVKVLRPSLAADPLYLQRFRREAEVMAQLKHPNIVRCYGVGKQFGRHYIAMELVEGRTLGSWLFRLGKLSVGDSLHVTLALAQALQSAHQNGLIHRDVKPENLMVTHDGQLKLGDLGLARPVLGENLDITEAGHGAGTPIYVAPEQARDARDADPRSDLYSLGCMLYQMLTGELPFGGDSALAVVLAKLEGHYTPVRSLVPGVSEELEAFLARLLKPHPDERYQCASDVVLEIGHLNLAAPVLSFAENLTDGTPLHLDEPPSRTESSLRETPTEGMLKSEKQGVLKSEKRWYVQSLTANGDQVIRCYTTDQVRSAMADEEFARTAEVSLYRGGFRKLEELVEFRDAALAWQDEASAPPGPQPAGLNGTGGSPPPGGALHLVLAVLLFILLGMVAVGILLGRMLDL